MSLEELIELAANQRLIHIEIRQNSCTVFVDGWCVSADMTRPLKDFLRDLGEFYLMGGA